MEKRALGRSGLEVGALALGTMNFGSDWLGSGLVDERAGRELLAAARDRGVNLLDTADIYGYGASEELLGRLLKGQRSKWLVATKVRAPMVEGDPASGGLSAKRIGEGLDASLKRLRTDHVDLYMPHWPDEGVPLEESLEAFAHAQKKGKVRVLGCSNFPPGLWKAALEWAGRTGPRLEFGEVQLSLAAPAAAREFAPLCEAAGTSLLAWSPLGGGFLTGKYRAAARPAGRRRDPAKAYPPLPERRLEGVLTLLEKVAALEGVTMAQAALGWTLAQPGVACAVVGARDLRQLEETLDARPLSPKTRSLLDRAAALVA
ncbi:MAG: aldo/keto reductase [Elusimicrobia bacterium]|nr:aldo/keto reductase [Elusimicrobiota bacterium]